MEDGRSSPARESNGRPPRGDFSFVRPDSWPVLRHGPGPRTPRISSLARSCMVAHEHRVENRRRICLSTRRTRTGMSLRGHSLSTDASHAFPRERMANAIRRLHAEKVELASPRGLRREGTICRARESGKLCRSGYERRRAGSLLSREAWLQIEREGISGFVL